MHSFSIILRPFFTFGVAINQASSLSIGPNNVNIVKTSIRENFASAARETSSGWNLVAMESNTRNKGQRSQKGMQKFTSKYSQLRMQRLVPKYNQLQ